MAASGDEADNAESRERPKNDIVNQREVCLGRGRKRRGCHVMSVTDRLDQTEDLLGCEVSDEALESSAGAGTAAVVRYTLAHCTSIDCALIS